MPLTVKILIGVMIVAHVLDVYLGRLESRKHANEMRKTCKQLDGLRDDLRKLSESRRVG